MKLGALFLVLMVLGAELLGRSLMPESVSPPVFRELDAPPGFALRPGYELRAGRMSVVIDDAGHRVVPGYTSRVDARVVRLIGDSQVFGWGITDADTIAAVLQRLLGERYRVVNYGVPGYGPFAYAAELETVPARDITIVLLTENNDLWDAYSAQAPASVHCGYLISRNSAFHRIPCAMLSSGILRLLAKLRARSNADALVLPLSRNPSARFASRVLAARVQRLLQRSEIRLGKRLIVSYVPWDGAVEPANSAHYRPRISGSERPSVEFRDDARVFDALRASPVACFQDDGHLSAAGAAVVAHALAGEVRRRR